MSFITTLYHHLTKWQMLATYSSYPSDSTSRNTSSSPVKLRRASVAIIFRFATGSKQDDNKEASLQEEVPRFEVDVLPQLRDLLQGSAPL